MSDHRYRPEVEILSVTDTGRRRRWTDAQKVRIVEESFGGRGRVAEAARRHDVGRTLLVRWRRGAAGEDWLWKIIQRKKPKQGIRPV